MMNSATFAILAASLIGSVHCAAMCGGFVCFYTGASVSRDVPAPTHATSLRTHSMYNVGRLLAYCILGAIAGGLGGHFTHLAAWAGMARGATVVAGTLMVLWAASHIASDYGVRVPSLKAPLGWQRFIGSLLQKLRDQAPATRAAATGLLTGLIPCGWLYVFVATAGAAGSPLAGATVMATFWLGTVPALLAVGFGVQRVLAPMRRQLPRLSAAVVLVVGLMAISGRLALSHVH